MHRNAAEHQRTRVSSKCPTHSQARCQPPRELQHLAIIDRLRSRAARDASGARRRFRWRPHHLGLLLLLRRWSGIALDRVPGAP
eukprot:6861682-Pyramimonas_sp.AAC.2